MQDVISRIVDELKIERPKVEGAVALLKDDATVPFIARYRKERTGGLDEVKLVAIRDRLKYLSELEQRRELVLKSINEAGKLTPELKTAVENAATKVELEDLYMPYRARRRTRSTAAKQKGLEPLADLIWKQEVTTGTAEEIVKPFITVVRASVPAQDVSAAGATGTEAGVTGTEARTTVGEEKGVKDMAEALAGARDIVAERIAEDAPCRKIARDALVNDGKVVTKAREGVDLAKGKFANYANFSEDLSKIPGHRILAVMRGSSEKQLSLALEAPREKILTELKAVVIKNPDAILKPDLILAIEESYDRLLGPSMDNELRQELKHRADLEAIEVFAKNLRALLLQAPLGEKTILAIDPGLRTGCKVAILDARGKLLEHAIIYPDKSDEERKTAGETLIKLIQNHKAEAVAIGNGTGGREADAFVREVLKVAAITGIIRVVVSESGASIYSASPVAREELPDVDLTVRGTVSIGRRLQDPLAELVKLDPKSIGVGQYQHDVDQTLLKQKLDEIVESCVNFVGVDINTASAPLLRYIAGIGPKLARSVIETRTSKGGFKSRLELLDIPGLGPKLYEQCAGFLRIRTSENPLDNSAVHPESYALVERMATAAGCAVKDLIGNNEKLDTLDLSQFKNDLIGEYTLKDIVQELKKPGRDPRDVFVNPEFNENVHEMKDLTEGLVLNGVVTNLTAFGAFVDIGVHQDGLVHISAITHKFIRDPSEAIAIGQHVKVKVLSVDAERKRISLSIKALQEAPVREARKPVARPAPRRGMGVSPMQSSGATPASGAASSSGAPRPPRPPRQDRGPRPPRSPRPMQAQGSGAPAGAATTPEGTPAPVGAASVTAAGPSPSTGPRQGGRFDRGPRRDGRPSGPGPGSGSARPPGSGQARPAGAGPNRSPGSGPDKRGERRAPPKPEPGKPDYSKFFVKGKRKDRDKEKKPRFADGASREEVREVMRKQQSSGGTLADLLKQAGVDTEEE